MGIGMGIGPEEAVPIWCICIWRCDCMGAEDESGIDLEPKDDAGERPGDAAGEGPGDEPVEPSLGVAEERTWVRGW